MDKLFKYILAIGSIVCLLGVSSYLAIMGRPAEAGVAIAAGFFGLVFANIEKFESFRGAGLEAKMRRAIDEAYATAESVKQLSLTSARIFLDLLAVHSRYGGIDYPQRIDMALEIDRILDELQVDEIERQRIRKIFCAYANFDHANRIIEAMRRELKLTTEEQSEVDNSLGFSKQPYANLPSAPTPLELRNFLTKRKRHSSDIDELIKDYEHFVAHGSLRRPETWSSA